MTTQPPGSGPPGSGPPGSGPPGSGPPGSGPPGQPPGGRPPVRPRVLAYPSATAVQFVLLVVATLAAGLFVGDWAHTIVEEESWRRVVAQCTTAGAGLPDDFTGQLAREAAFDDCAAPAQRRRAAYAIGGLLVATATGVAVLLLAPLVISRRRRLRPPAAKFAPAVRRFAELAGLAGLRTPPALMIGSARQRDAFSYGLPGRYRVVLPLAVAIQLRPWYGTPAGAADKVRRRLESEAVVAHELAHVARRDVALAWAVTAAGYALVPMLLLPVLLTAIRGDLSLVPDYAWRAALLGAVIVLLRAALLRSREHDADLRAIDRGTNLPALDATLSGIPRRPARWRGILANHPRAETRMAVVRRPETAVRAGFLDGLSLAFLAALLPSLIDLVVIPWFFGSAQKSLTNVVYAVLAGALAGGGLGLAWWRAALIRRLVGAGPRLAPLVAGVFTGFLAGAAVSLGGIGSGPFGGASPLLLAVTALAAAGATVVTAGFGELWADAAHRLPRAWLSWATAVFVPGLLFAVVLWAAAVIQKMWGGLGWAWASTALQSLLDRGPVVAAMLVLAVAAVLPVVLANRPLAPHPSSPTSTTVSHRGAEGALAPAWLVEAGPRPYWPAPVGRIGLLALVAAVAAGLAGAAVLIGFRLVAGPAADRIEVTQRYYMYILLAVAVAAVAAAGLAIAVPGRGSGMAALAVPVATVVTMVGFIALNTALGGDLRPSFVAGVLRAPLAPALLATMVVLACGAVLPAARVGPAPGSLALPAARVGLSPGSLALPAARVGLAPGSLALSAVAIFLAAGAAAGAVVAARDALVPLGPIRILEQASAGPTTTGPTTTGPTTTGPTTTGPTAGPGQASSGATGSDPAGDVAFYRDEVAPAISAIYTAIETEVRTIDADPALDEAGRAAAVRATVLPELRDLRDVAQAVRVDVPAVRAAHAQCLEALDSAITAFEGFATAYENSDAQLLAQAQQTLTLHTSQWRAWQAAVQTL